MRFHPELHLKDLSGRLHWPPRPGMHADVISHHHSVSEDAEVAKATIYVSALTAIVLLVVLAGISFGQEVMHWLGAN